MDDSPVWKDRKFLISLIVMALVGMTVYRIFWSTPAFSTDLQSMAIGVILGQALQYVLKFWLNSSSESEKKNETINTLVKKEP